MSVNRMAHSRKLSAKKLGELQHNLFSNIA